jgi:hypothetical protein
VIAVNAEIQPVPPWCLLDIGIEAVEGGLAVFFLSRAKTPLKGSRGFYDAKCDAEQLRELFRTYQYRGATYLAYATGTENRHPDHGVVPASGFAVLDLDFKHSEAVAWYEKHKHRLDTFTYMTRSGGRHLVFQDHPKLKTCAGNIETGVDVKARGDMLARGGCAATRSCATAIPSHGPSGSIFRVIRPQPGASRPQRLQQKRR